MGMGMGMGMGGGMGGGLGSGGDETAADPHGRG